MAKATFSAEATVVVFEQEKSGRLVAWLGKRMIFVNPVAAPGFQPSVGEEYRVRLRDSGSTFTGEGKIRWPICFCIPADTLPPA